MRRSPSKASSRATHHPTDYRSAGSVDDLTQANVKAIQQLEHEASRVRGPMDRFADHVSAFCGSALFFWVHVAWFAGWIAFNARPGAGSFDPYPFTFLTLVVSLEAIFLSTFILISQNHAARISERRNQLDLQINLLTEQENTKMLQMLDRIAHAVGVVDDEDPSLQVLEQAMRPDKLAEQIDKAASERA
jgi:uncharacterized membrane protein